MGNAFSDSKVQRYQFDHLQEIQQEFICIAYKQHLMFPLNSAVLRLTLKEKAERVSFQLKFNLMQPLQDK